MYSGLWETLFRSLCLYTQTEKLTMKLTLKYLYSTTSHLCGSVTTLGVSTLSSWAEALLFWESLFFVYSILRRLTGALLAGVGQVVVAGNVAPAAAVVPHHHHAILPGQEVAVGLTREPVLIQLRKRINNELIKSERSTFAFLKEE